MERKAEFFYALIVLEIITLHNVLASGLVVKK